MIQFTVYGLPVPQGSKKAVPIYRGGKPVMKNGRALTRVVSDNPNLGQWRQQTAEAARRAYDGPLFSGAMELMLKFIRPRPKSHYGTGRNAGVVKPSAPAHPISRPDTLKLSRGIEDALTNVIWVDDSQIVQHVIKKEWGDCYRVLVSVISLDGVTRDEAAELAEGE